MGGLVLTGRSTNDKAVESEQTNLENNPQLST